MNTALKRVLSSPFIRFAFSGGLAAGVNILSRLALSQIFPYSVAIAIAFLLGMVTAFTLMKLLVFEKTGQRVHHEYLRFCLVNAVAFVQVWAVSLVLAQFVLPALGVQAYSETIAHVIGVLSPIVTSYFLHKHFTFSKTGS
ncbi:putative flippase GtrA [Neorhizobium galegae]|uniref:GtrA family protein n=1 Tax=Neorhizobium galegae TaxID=399 RepID=UPI001AEA7A95|nr:GtrA family protein [Neorhizobium galegae]MBP2550644.1 putative flippase GtrA [Neorhizobium galegae]